MSGKNMKIIEERKYCHLNNGGEGENKSHDKCKKLWDNKGNESVKGRRNINLG